MTAPAEVRVELLLSKPVRALNGKVIGRIEELRAEPRGEDLVIAEFLIGPRGLLERLSIYVGAFPIVRWLMATSGSSRYRVAWQQLDVSDPERPRLLCRVDELTAADPP